ncbi:MULTISPECIES: PAS domain-containing methyl-accepting chemotaxis protein [unclassified Bradyrhizobium]|uniref:methyl-accepting chemotaxis protein n=1 Tax=Bradyrhizobium TaxID=374 RepID=UPI00291639E6|nr:MULTISPECIES: PAS domain-containing methyl-accepting chemotaxis protein [unclassified Bradyrhizobium]
MAVIEFQLDGTIITANKNFLNALGYQLEEIQGRHHSMFVEPSERDGAAYREFWAALSRGELKAAEFKRIGKGGREIWIEASYNPVLDSAGKPVKVVKFATDITEKKLRSMADGSKLAAIDRAQAMIEFKLDGTIVSANKNFLDALGYRLDEIQGKHHSMFVEPALRDSAAYREFWAALNRGEYQGGEYKRIGKGGKEVWILATYNPVLDATGRPIGVVKFATDVTAQKLKNADLAGQIEAIGKSQAVIEFNMDGTVITANDNFLHALGYTLAEIRGKHHSMFVEPSERESAAYRDFWASLNRGQYQSAEYKRIGKGGREVYIQASYNPILDLNGKPFKVVKYATDVTRQVFVRMGNERVRAMMESVAAGAEELNASVREISEAMTKSRETAMGAVDRVTSADAQAQRLSDAAQSMSGIVEMIHNITGQINLLALNATIESARAGEAGRGFAVVASEVKNLATQAKTATDKIATEIDSLNNISGGVVTSLGSIKQAIQNVSEYVTSTAAAVEEQSTVTSEMSSSMARAAAEAQALAERAAA